jgi:hypothetical protein
MEGLTDEEAVHGEQIVQILREAETTGACVRDEHTRECLAIEVACSLTSRDVILTLARLIRRPHEWGKTRFGDEAGDKDLDLSSY